MADETGEGLAHAELRWHGGGGVMLGDQAPDNPDQLELPNGASNVYAVTDQPDDLYEQAINAGAEIISDLRNEEVRISRLRVSGPRRQRMEFRNLSWCMMLLKVHKSATAV